MTLTIMCKFSVEGRLIVLIFIFSPASYLVSGEAYLGKFKFVITFQLYKLPKMKTSQNLSCRTNSAASWWVFFRNIPSRRLAGCLSIQFACCLNVRNIRPKNFEQSSLAYFLCFGILFPAHFSYQKFIFTRQINNCWARVCKIICEVTQSITFKILAFFSCFLKSIPSFTATDN